MNAKNHNLSGQYPEYSQLQLPELEREILSFWNEQQIFMKSTSTRKDAPAFVFYEGPPSVNAMPGIHHVMGRTIKDIFARFQTMNGFRVERKGGRDTHGLPIELNVEKNLGITKKDIGTKISVEEFNAVCRKEVLKCKDWWDDLTQKMGYWVDLDTPYITYENKYIESLWALLKRLYDKGYLYKGYTIQPFSPAAGTQLSSHELNQPGCYRDVKDTSVTAQFKLVDSDNEYFLAWTTTPWTLPSNTALAVGENIIYAKIHTLNPYTGIPVKVILAKDLLHTYFKDSHENLPLDSFKMGEKDLPWSVISEHTGKELTGIRYEQLLPYAKPESGDYFKVIIGDFVTTHDGTGIVHIAPSFGADDMRVAKQFGIGSLTLVNRFGRFTDEVSDFAGLPVKNYDDDPDYESVDVKIAIKLKQENKAFRVEKYEHSYPHCWRTDKPIIYYPMDSWFIKTTAVKDRMVELNKTINWKPKSTGEGRFGQWLENLIDWNLSRTRFWGTPLPIWREIDGSEEKCIGSIQELREEVLKSIEAGFMKAPLPDNFDLHKPFVDDVFLTSSTGKKMKREEDLVDVWFDSGAMPYAQWHYPFENQDIIDNGIAFPADFIAEGVDQTRGWFYTLHALSVLLFDSIAYKNVISNGLVLDKNGNKMSKRLNNGVNPFETIEKYGADATRWYMISNARPWDNLRFDLKGITEVQRSFFGTLYNTYSFFALYANIDGYTANPSELLSDENYTELDKWILSKLNSLMLECKAAYADYEPTKAARAIEHFTDEHLSNWYVRLSRRRFWKGEMNADKKAAYQTLGKCLLTLSQIMAPIAPFFADWPYLNLRKPLLNSNSKLPGEYSFESIHLSYLTPPAADAIDLNLEERMHMAQVISSLVLSLRKKEKLKVRQPMQRILVPLNSQAKADQLKKVESYILSEVNVKSLEIVDDTSAVVNKKIKPDFKKLGPKLGTGMKEAASLIQNLTQQEIRQLETERQIALLINNSEFLLQLEDVDVLSDDIQGWLVASSDDLTVALDIHLTEELIAEGHARELVNKVQTLRKESGLNVTDRIVLYIQAVDELALTLTLFNDYICNEILATQILVNQDIEHVHQIEVNEIPIKVRLELNQTK